MIGGGRLDCLVEFVGACERKRSNDPERLDLCKALGGQADALLAWDCQKSDNVSGIMVRVWFRREGL